MKLKTFILFPALILPVIPAIVMWATGYGGYYCGTLLIFYACFGLMEWLSVKKRNKTISKDIASTPPGLFWSIIGTWTAMNVLLSLHWLLMR